MKILLLGANGQLGTELHRRLPRWAQVVPATRNGRLADGGACEVADLERPEDLVELVRRVQPDVVVNTAAWTAVDPAEAERERAFAVNARAPAVLAQACAARDILLVHYSTDYVFDGALQRPYRESDVPHPLNAYGQSKLAGELAVRDSGVRHLVLRVSWIFAEHSNSFFRSVLRWANERERLQVVDDQIGIPTPARLIADATAVAISRAQADRHLRGLWHLTASGQVSRHAFADAIVREGHARGLIASMPTVEAIGSERFPAEAVRPGYSALDNRAFQAAFGMPLPHWRDGMIAVLDAMAASNHSS